MANDLRRGITVIVLLWRLVVARNLPFYFARLLVERREPRLTLVHSRHYDELLGQQQVVIKNLETHFRKVAGVAGATILGDGRVALILDLLGLSSISTHEATLPQSVTN